MSLKTSWIVVADASHAHVYRAREKNQPWTLVTTLDHPAARERNQDLVSDRPGRTQQSPGHTGDGKGSRSGMEASLTAKQAEQLHFAAELVSYLQTHWNGKEFQSLVVVAPPHFLGILREKMPAALSKCIAAEVDKNYTHLSEKDLRSQLQDIWAYV